METILAALITGAVTLIGVLIANSKSQAVTDTKLEELTREVREHNNFARRVPILEEQMKVANHRISDLEDHELVMSRSSVRIGSVAPTSERTISDICREFGVNESWLRTGEGEMFAAPTAASDKIMDFAAEVARNDDKKNFVSDWLSCWPT